MRLHHLRVQAFLAFPGTEHVDFDALADGGLFLLQGRTGAGKTSLLDAVCFALYGRVPGARDADARLRSDHAAPELRTEVELEATLRGRRVRILRSPQQERPKQRGDGLTTEQHRVLVGEVRPDGSTAALATRHDEAGLLLADLLGMDRDQFCQVVLLPQGGFAKFLHAKTDDRAELLRDLFDVGRFADVEGWLKGRKEDAQRAMYEALDVVKRVVAAAAEAAGAPAPEGWQDDPPLAAAWLGEQRDAADAACAAAQEACAAAGEAAEARRTALEAARALAGLQEAHAHATEELGRWEAARARRDEAAAELAAARRAAPAGAHVEALATRAAAEETAAAAADAALEAARAAGVAVERAAPPGDVAPDVALFAVEERADPADGELTLFDLSALGGAGGPDRRTSPGEGAAVEVGLAASTPRGPSPAGLRACAAELRERAGFVAGLLPREQAAEAAGRRLAALRAEAGEARAAGEAAGRRLAELQAARPALETARDAAKDAAGALGGLQERAARAQAAAEAGSARDALVPRVAEARERFVATRSSCVDAAEARLALVRRRLDGMAAELAGHLADGAPCAVCGAVEHPAPAAAPEGGLVAEEELQAADEAVREAERVRDAAGEALQELEAQLTAARAVAGDAEPAALARTATDAAAAVARAQALADGLEAAETALAEAGAAAEAAEAARRAAEVRASELAAQAGAQEAALAADREELERARDGAPTLAARAAALTGAAQAAEDAAAALEAASRAGAEAAEAREAAARAAELAGFAAPDEVRAALRDGAACDRLEQQITVFDEGLAQRRAAAGREELVAAAAQAAPDVVAAHDAAQEAARAAEAAQQALALAGGRQEALARLHADLADALAASEPARARFAEVRELADLAIGKGANRKRINLEAYVLAARLEEVAAAASDRFARMSEGRYTFAHDDSTAKGNRRGGLDLKVLDAWTGRDRSPTTLSGGETFKASLALALGLAEVVSHEAGGAMLETLFVDEGFGTLDDEGTLDEVLEVLDGLRDGGRVVGIVSHVAELRQRIPAQVRVERSRAGSTVSQGLAAQAG